MKFASSFNGKIIQVTEALDFGDAISNQIIALDEMFRRFGFCSAIYSKWCHESVAQSRSDIEKLHVDENDILIYHFYGYSEFTLAEVLQRYCTKILVYHNITPHEFFKKDSALYNFCRKGRSQLKDMLSHFHYFWGDSDYNLEELRGLGASPEACRVVPIIVDSAAVGADAVEREAGTWLFLGRIAPNKGQHELVRLFGAVRGTDPLLAQRLFLVGGYDSNDPYYVALKKNILDLGLEPEVTITGKVSDADREDYFKRAALYVSASQHEGFGVPLVEAPLRGLPVVALSNAAVGEVMGQGAGIASNLAELKALATRILLDPRYRRTVIEKQVANSARFAPVAVERQVMDALRSVLPAPNQFKTLSVVICTYNRCHYLDRVLDYLRYQTSSDFEVVVVDGPSDDGTKEFLDRCSGNIKIAHHGERNLSKSRNLGIELADGDIVAFIDDDAIPFDDWVETILREYNSRPLTTAGLGGPVYYAGTFWFQAQDNGINKQGEAKVNIDSAAIGKDGWFRYNTGTNATFTRDFLKQVRGFDEEFEYFLDESELCFRIQAQKKLIGYSRDVLVRHEFAQSHNREGKFKYNWFSICKNTAYFVAAYAGLKGRALKDHVEQRMRSERIAPLDEALAAGNIEKDEHGRHVSAIWAGVEQGLKDAHEFPKLRKLKEPPGNYKAFATGDADSKALRRLRRLHICILSKEFPPFAAGGGIGTLYYHLASELLLMGHDVTVIVPTDNDHVFEQGRFRVVFAKKHALEFGDIDSGFGSNLSWSCSALGALAKVHEQKRIDVVDTALWDTEAITFALLPVEQRPPLVVRLVTPYPVAARLNEWQPEPGVAELFTTAERRLIARANAVVPISESVAKTIEFEHRVVRDKRWRIVPCGIAYWPFFDVNQDYTQFQEFEKIPSAVLKADRLVVFVGRLERRKGIDLLLSAAADILAAEEQAHILIAGRDVEGWANRIESLLPAQFRDRVHYVGEVADATREKLLAKAYCLVFPSRYESFGLVPLEAFVHGVPVVASRSGAIPEVVEHGVSGLLFEAEVSASLASCVVELLRNRQLRDRLATGAKNRVRQLSSRNSAIATIHVYSQLIVASPTETQHAEHV